MFTSKEKLQKLRSKDKCLAIYLWHEETFAKMYARLLQLKRSYPSTNQ